MARFSRSGFDDDDRPGRSSGDDAGFGRAGIRQDGDRPDAGPGRFGLEIGAPRPDDAPGPGTRTPDTPTPGVPRDSGPAEPAAPAAPSAVAAGLPPADELGWGPAAWEDAGGFLSILGGGGLGDGGDPGEGETPPPVVNLFIDTLDIDIFNVIQNTLIQNTSVIFDAANGGSILVGGDVAALGSQTALAGDGGLGPF